MNGQRATTLRFLAEPGHVNFGGKVHGGAVMKWIDQAGYACAAGWTGEYCVTVYVGGIHFIRPILVGELVEVRARVAYTGRTSVHVAIDVHAGDPRARDLQRTVICVIVFVAVGEDGKPKTVPRWVPETEYDHLLEWYARRMLGFRKLLEQEVKARQL
jgi:acyl-CoA hydrolase